jgi:hypothetical protein
MRRLAWVAMLIVALVAVGRGPGAEPCCRESSQDCGLTRLGPAGGWDPYGGGLLHWWNPHWFPHSGAPDDYCRKPLPRFGWGPYPPFYIWGRPEGCCHDNHGR